MTIMYYRPTKLEETVALLEDKDKNLKPMGGGTRLKHEQAGLSGVVDLQSLNLNYLINEGGWYKAGATLSLATLLTHEGIQSEIKRAVQVDAQQDLIDAATIGGWLVSSDGHSIFSTVLLALDAVMTWEPDKTEIQLGDWLPLRKMESPGVLITEIRWRDNLRLAFEYVAHSPEGRPVLIVAVAQWKSGRTRLALGGFGESPIIAMDGSEANGVNLASRDAYYEAEDQWASAEFRRESAAKLALSCVERLEAEKENED